MARKPKKPKEEELPEDDDLLLEEEAPAEAEDASEEDLEDLLLDEDAEPADEDASSEELLLDEDAAPSDDDVISEEVLEGDEDAAPADDDSAADELLLDDDAAPVADDDSAADELLSDDELAAAADGPSLDDAPPLDDELADDDAAPPGDDEAIAEDEPEEPAKIPARNNVLTLVLCLLNLAAVVGFLFLAVLDFNRRQASSYYVFRNDFELWALPLAEEETMVTGFQATKAMAHIDADQLKKEYEERKRKLFGPDFKGIGSDVFLPANEVVGQRITPQQLSDDVLKEIFKDVGGEPVRTLQDEVERVKKKLMPAIEAAAAETAQNAKTEEEKRKKLAELLLPLAYTPHEIDVVDTKIKAAKAADLDRLLVDAAQRKMLMGVLEPLQEIRPRTDEDRKVLEASSDPEVPALEKLKIVLNKRLDEAALRTEPGKAKQDSWERRSNIAYLLFTVSQLRKPDNQPLDAKAVARVEVAVGMYEYAVAAEDFAIVLGKLQGRMARAVAAEREGWSFVNNASKVEKINKFVGDYQEEIRNILDLVSQIKRAETHLGTLLNLKDGHTKNFEERKKDYDTTVNKLIVSREETARLTVELRRYERQLFEAQKELADAYERNQQLERDIRTAERPFLKGGQKR